MMDQLLELDKALFLAVHLGAQHPLLDAVCPLLREKLFWAPLYLFVASYMWFNVRKGFWHFLLGCALLVTAADTLSSKIIKPAVHRLRPCNDQELAGSIRPLVPCGSGFSFTSSHATNHFAIAWFFMGCLGWAMGRWRFLWLIWASSVALSQVYVGVHYPGDILAGALIGSLLGIAASRIFRNLNRQPFADNA